MLDFLQNPIDIIAYKGKETMKDVNKNIDQRIKQKKLVRIITGRRKIIKETK